MDHIDDNPYHSRTHFTIALILAITAALPRISGNTVTDLGIFYALSE